MFIIRHTLFTLLFIIATSQGNKDVDPIDINNSTVPIPITEVNPVTAPPYPEPTSSTTTKPITTTEAPTPPPKPSPTPSPNVTTSEKPTTPTPNVTTTEKPTSTTVRPTNGTTIVPSPSTTVAPPTSKPNPTASPTDAPAPASHRHFDGASFIGGIILALGLVAIGFVSFKFYKARTELNYHTL